jgi:hypothetical protein
MKPDPPKIGIGDASGVASAPPITQTQRTAASDPDAPRTSRRCTLWVNRPAARRDTAADSAHASRAVRQEIDHRVAGFAGDQLARARGTRGVERMQVIQVPTMILPKVRDPRFVTIRRGGTLTDSDHHLLALWAASCAEHVLDLFESAQPDDPRPREAIEHARAWVRGEVKMTQARTAAGHAMAAARDLRGAARHAAYAAAKRGSSRTLPRTNLVRPPMRSRPHVPARRRARATAQGDSSAGGSVTSSRRRFASSYLTTSGCGTTSAGRCLTAECASGR